jgi:4-amino-4-deoxy-L-arabinose transferase-like glycosyltransferase
MTTTRRGVPAKILFWLAVIMVIAWLVARWWGVTDVETITRGQRKLLIAAGVLFGLSWLPFPSLPKFSREIDLRLPSRLEFVILVLLAVLIVTLDILWSQSAGLLAYPPYYDGIGYVFDAKRAIHLLITMLENPNALRHGSTPDLLLAPLWKILIMVHFLVLGVGEWQAYSVRFWPTFLLLFLVFWFVRKENNSRTAWIAAGFTAMLPTLSVSLRATLEDFYGNMSSANVWYLADLRPDLLFAVLLLWAIAPLVEYANKLDSRLWITSGSAAALALLTKPSAGSLLALGLGMAILAVLFINRSKARDTLTASLWGFSSFFLLVIPWVAFGGLGRTFRYVYRSAVSQRELWSDANATIWSEFTYYWHWYSIHMGVIEGFVFLACGLIGLVLTLKRNSHRRNIGATTYFIIALVLYGIVSASPSKNYFLGLPFSLVLWLFSWVSLSAILRSITEKRRIIAVALATFATVYVGLMLSSFAYAVKNWPEAHKQSAAQTRAMIQEMAHDLNQILTGSDRFMAAALFGVPATFYFYMIQRDGSYPRQCPFDPLASPPERTIEKLGVDCKAFLLYESNEDQRKYSSTPSSALIRWEAIAKWVKDPRNFYRRIKTYRLSNQVLGAGINATGESFTMELYVLDTVPGSAGAP